jgi:hypothetical protein
MSASETVSEVLEALATIPDGQPVVMINLLRGVQEGEVR